MASKAVEILLAAQKRAMEIRPKIGGFPVLAEVLKQAGVVRNIWHLPSCQSTYITKQGPVVFQLAPLITGFADIPLFNEEKLVEAIRTDQAGKTEFPQFLLGVWNAGVVRYEVDFEARNVAYYGVGSEVYLENYPEVKV